MPYDANEVRFPLGISGYNPAELQLSSPSAGIYDFVEESAAGGGDVEGNTAAIEYQYLKWSGGTGNTFLLLYKAGIELAGTLTSSGSLLRNIGKALAGTWLPEGRKSLKGTLTRATGKQLKGFFSISQNIPNMWFEGALPTGWWWWSDNGTGSVAYSTADSHSGTGSAKVTCGSSTGGYTGSGYNLSVPAGTTAYVTAWVKCANTAANKIELMFSELIRYSSAVNSISMVNGQNPM
jgi:hypothetical protein